MCAIDDAEPWAVANPVKRTLIASLLVLGAAACTPTGSPPPTAPLQYSCGTAPRFCPNPTSPAAASTGLAPAGCLVVAGTADRRCTPGALNPNVTQDTIHQTICVPHWTDPPVRPPTSYTNALKRTQKIAYGEAAIPDDQLKEDHLVNLGIGGAPRDPRNLWPEPSVGLHHDGAGDKDKEELALQRAVCAPGSKLLLADAQAQILAHWSH